jgi:hypothetical protein
MERKTGRERETELTRFFFLWFMYVDWMGWKSMSERRHKQCICVGTQRQITPPKQ